jgi:hypothetical protein
MTVWQAVVRKRQSHVFLPLTNKAYCQKRRKNISGDGCIDERI